MCRCGHPSNKPFCDGTHATIDFDGTLANAVTGASAGMFGGVWAQAELRKVLGAMGARVAESEVAVGHATSRVDPDGRLNEPNLEEEVREVAATLIAEAKELADPGSLAA